MQDPHSVDSSQDINGVQSASKKAGLPPGTLVYIGREVDFKPELEILSYTHETAEIHKPLTPAEAKAVALSEGVAWVTLFGIHDVEMVGQMGKEFGIHALILEDILDTTQRPTSEVFEDSLFFSLKMHKLSAKKGGFLTEQISVVLRDGQVLLFQQRPGDIYDGIRQRILAGKGVIRKKGADFLVYRLIDTVVDQYFVIAEALAEKIERLETEIIQAPEETQMTRLLKLKKQLLKLRRNIVPLKDNVGLLERSQHRMIKDETLPYLKDVSDHIKEVIEMLDLHRETVTGLIDLYMSTTNNQMNEVMKVLTVITSIFIPLSFIAGIYGMNFVNIPELSHPNGYFILWGAMGAVTLLLLIYFRRKKWL